MKEFDGNDARYRIQLREHHEGFVLNRLKGKSNSYLALYRAICLTISICNKDGSARRLYRKQAPKGLRNQHKAAEDIHPQNRSL